MTLAAFHIRENQKSRQLTDPPSKQQDSRTHRLLRVKGRRDHVYIQNSDAARSPLSANSAHFEIESARIIVGVYVIPSNEQQNNGRCAPTVAASPLYGACKRRTTGQKTSPPPWAHGRDCYGGVGDAPPLVPPTRVHATKTAVRDYRMSSALLDQVSDAERGFLYTGGTKMRATAATVQRV